MFACLWNRHNKAAEGINKITKIAAEAKETKDVLFLELFLEEEVAANLIVDQAADRSLMPVNMLTGILTRAHTIKVTARERTHVYTRTENYTSLHCSERATADNNDNIPRDSSSHLRFIT